MIYNSPDTITFDLSNAAVSDNPFPHFTATHILPENNISELYNWFVNTTSWHLVETDFYEQYEFSLLSAAIPEHLQNLVSKGSMSLIEDLFKQRFGVKNLDLVDIVAHKLVNSQHIGVHNDFINGEETHRMVLHVNPEWKDEDGGYLMLFNSGNSQDLSKLVKPMNNTAFGFEISKRSHHAVSQINDFVRYTIVYTFKSI
jgi:Rps23 Pro-64 3,4-dihydroxylase Tpa1-like proline 4-hydroxylase